MRLSYLDVQVDAFREKPRDSGPGSAWAVAIAEQNVQSLMAKVGGKLNYLIDQPWGSLQPRMDFSWVTKSLRVQLAPTALE